MNIIISGRPGAGKSTLVKELSEQIPRETGGMITTDIREQGKRKGFKVLDLSTDKEGTLAHVDRDKGPKISKYRVNLQDLNEVGVRAIEEAVEKADVVVIDEIGPMELKSQEFKKTIKRAFNSDKDVVATVHRKLTDKYRDKGEFFWLKRRNFEELKKEALELLIQ